MSKAQHEGQTSFLEKRVLEIEKHLLEARESQETFDREISNRSTQAEEIQEKNDDILVEGDSRAGNLETSTLEPSKLVGVEERMIEQIKSHVQDAMRSHLEQQAKFEREIRERLAQQDGLVDQSLMNQIKIQVENAMGSHREQQAAFEKRFQHSYETQQAEWQRRLTTSSNNDSISADIEARWKSHESRLRKISDEVASQMQETARSHRGRTEELGEQQARLHSTVLQQLGDAKLQHNEQLAEATSSMRGELNVLKSQLSSICSDSVVAELQAEVSSLAKTVEQCCASGNINKEEFDSEKRNLWEAVMQLQVQHIKEAKQRATDALAGFPDLNTDTTIISGPDAVGLAKKVMAKVIPDPNISKAEPIAARSDPYISRAEPLVDRSLLVDRSWLESEPLVAKSFPGISISSPDGTSRLQPTLKSASPPRAAKVIRSPSRASSPPRTSRIISSTVVRAASPARGRSAAVSPGREERSRVTPSGLHSSYQPPPSFAQGMTTVPRVIPSYQPPPAPDEGLTTVPRVMTSYQPPLQPLEGMTTVPRVVARQASLPGSLGDRGARAGSLPGYTYSAVRGS